MKINKILKVASVAVLATTLAACGKEKVSKKDYEKWATDNGYVLESGLSGQGYVKNPDYQKWATDNGYIKPVAEDTRAELELSLGDTMSSIDADYLKNYIGGFTGEGASLTETFGEKKDMLVFYGINECATCDAIKPVVNAWVKSSGNKVYYYNPDNSMAAAPIKKEILRKLGSANGTELVGPILAAFVDGKLEGSLSGTDITDKNIGILVETYFKTNLGAKTVKSSKELENLADLRKSIANNEQFILYATRFNCPWCRKLSDTARDNALNKLMRSYTGNLYTITSEKVRAEFDSIYVLDDGAGNITIAKPDTTTGQLPAGAINVWAWWYLQDNGATVDFKNETNIPTYWPNTTTSVQKAEVLLYLVATGEVTPHVTSGEITEADQIAFIKEVRDYAAKTANKKFLSTDRNIPAFIAVGWSVEDEEANTTAINAIISRRASMVAVDFETDEISINMSAAHRALFPEYFTGATSGKTDITYVTPEAEVTAAFHYLSTWVNSWKYRTAE